MSFPDFIIVGGAKCGTTALHQWLRTHPEIRMPDRELNFFSMLGQPYRRTPAMERVIVPDLHAYRAAFPAEVLSGHVIGEKSVSYLYGESVDTTIKNIRLFHPKAETLKIVILLRDPVQRAYSQYLANVSNKMESLAFAAAIAAWKERRLQQLPPQFDYLGMSRYAKPVAAYMRAFPDIRIYFFEDLIRDPTAMVGELFRFLGVNPAWRPPNLGSNPNPGQIPRSLTRDRLHTLVRRNPFVRLIMESVPDSGRKALFRRARKWAYTKPPLAASLAADLRPYFIDDLREVERLLNRPLPPSWFEANAT
jgi:hypothetical protein